MAKQTETQETAVQESAEKSRAADKSSKPPAELTKFSPDSPWKILYSEDSGVTSYLEVPQNVGVVIRVDKGSEVSMIWVPNVSAKQLVK